MAESSASAGTAGLAGSMAPVAAVLGGYGPALAAARAGFLVADEPALAAAAGRRAAVVGSRTLVAGGVPHWDTSAYSGAAGARGAPAGRSALTTSSRARSGTGAGAGSSTRADRE